MAIDVDIMRMHGPLAGIHATALGQRHPRDNHR
jgi:hypothetical protein